jgi:hypothetical protein
MGSQCRPNECIFDLENPGGSGFRVGGHMG